MLKFPLTDTPTQTQAQRELMFRVRWQILIDQAEFDMDDWVSSETRDIVIFEKTNKDNPSAAAYSWFQIQLPTVDPMHITIDPDSHLTTAQTEPTLAEQIQAMSCNTVRCVAGWTVTLNAPTQLAADEEVVYLISIDNSGGADAWIARGAELLGLRHDTAEELFVPSYHGQSVLATLQALDYLLEFGDFPRYTDSEQHETMPIHWRQEFDHERMRELFPLIDSEADDQDYELVVGGVL